MGFNDWIRIDPAPMSVDSRQEEIDTEAKDTLAGEIQTRLRTGADPGIDLKSARRAQRIRVVAKGGSIVIDEHDQSSVLRGGMAQEHDISEARAGGMVELFKMSSGVPEATRSSDGTNRLVFRSIAADKLFAQQEGAEQDRTVQETVTETLRMGIVDAFDGAAKKVEIRYPEDKIK